MQVSVIWPDGHESKFDTKWLLDRAFTKEKLIRRQNEFDRPERVLWDKEYGKSLKKFKYGDIMKDDDVLYRWLRGKTSFNNRTIIQILILAEQIYGLTIVEEMPCEESSLKTLVSRIGLLAPTHYGVDFTVLARSENANNLAYTSSSLGLHTDLPYYNINPSVQFLHCIKQYEMDGAENEFADGYYLAQIIEEEYPEEWKILTTVPIDFQDVGEEPEPYGEFHKVNATPSFMYVSKSNFEVNNMCRVC